MVGWRGGEHQQPAHWPEALARDEASLANASGQCTRPTTSPPHHLTTSPAALFVYQFEVMCRNRLGYDEGLDCMAADSLYSDDWRAYLQVVRHQVGLVDFADLIYLRSEFYVQEQKRRLRTTNRRSRRSLARRKGRSPAPTVAVIRCTSSQPCKGSSAIPKCHDPGHATIRQPSWKRCKPDSASWRCV